MQARFYLPMWGRFASPDPGRDQHFEETQSWNIYSYVQNSPIMNFDPNGMEKNPYEAYKNLGPQEQAYVKRNLSKAWDARQLQQITYRYTNSSVSGLKDGPGSLGTEVNAFRHGLWTALFTMKHGADEAKLMTDSHEYYDDLKSDLSKLPSREYFSLDHADSACDLLNNKIAMDLGENLRGSDIDVNGVAQRVLSEFAIGGFWQVKPGDTKSSFKIEKKVIQNDTYLNSRVAILELDNEGKQKGDKK